MLTLISVGGSSVMWCVVTVVSAGFAFSLRLYSLFQVSRNPIGDSSDRRLC